jgi:hypothetical protein
VPKESALGSVCPGNEHGVVRSRCNAIGLHCIAAQ